MRMQRSLGAVMFATTLREYADLPPRRQVLCMHTALRQGPTVPHQTAPCRGNPNPKPSWCPSECHHHDPHGHNSNSCIQGLYVQRAHVARPASIYLGPSAVESYVQATVY